MKRPAPGRWGVTSGSCEPATVERLLREEITGLWPGQPCLIMIKTLQV